MTNWTALVLIPLSGETVARLNAEERAAMEILAETSLVFEAMLECSVNAKRIQDEAHKHTAPSPATAGEAVLAFVAAIMRTHTVDAPFLKAQGLLSADAKTIVRGGAQACHAYLEDAQANMRLESIAASLRCVAAGLQADTWHYSARVIQSLLVDALQAYDAAQDRGINLSTVHRVRDLAAEIQGYCAASPVRPFVAGTDEWGSTPHPGVNWGHGGNAPIDETDASEGTDSDASDETDASEE